MPHGHKKSYFKENDQKDLQYYQKGKQNVYKDMKKRGTK